MHRLSNTSSAFAFTTDYMEASGTETLSFIPKGRRLNGSSLFVKEV